MLRKTNFLDLSEKTIIISGGSEGVGIEVAELLSTYGAKIALLDKSSTGHKGIERLCSKGRVAKFYRCDVTKFKDCKYVIEQIKKDFGKIDVLFNNEEEVFRKTLVEIEEKQNDLILDIGLKGTYQLSKVAIPVMVQGGGGSIVNTCTFENIKDLNPIHAYSVIKRGISKITKDMAITYEDKNIRVNSINIDNNFNLRIKNAEYELKLIENLLSDDLLKGKKLSILQDIKKVILFLASDLSSWVTGTNLVIDKEYRAILE